MFQVNNTDAEGRLTLADALVYACNLGVDKVYFPFSPKRHVVFVIFFPQIFDCVFQELMLLVHTI